MRTWCKRFKASTTDETLSILQVDVLAVLPNQTGLSGSGRATLGCRVEDVPLQIDYLWACRPIGRSRYTQNVDSMGSNPFTPTISDRV